MCSAVPAPGTILRTPTQRTPWLTNWPNETFSSSLVAAAQGETARTALKLGVPVTGIIPTFLINQETPVEDLSELKVVADMHERKAKMAELSDLFVVLPGGIGTMEEACEMITGNWIGLYNKPVGFLNVNGFFDAFFAFLKDAVNAGFMPKPCYERAIVDSTASGLIDKLLATRLAPELPRNADCFDHK